MPKAAAQPANDDRRFRVHAKGGGAHHSRVVLEPNFEAAAVAFLEDYVPVGEADDEVSVIVRDLDGGAEHCFRVDVGSGEIEPCG
jgi:hypothetical protein